LGPVVSGPVLPSVGGGSLIGCVVVECIDGVRVGCGTEASLVHAAISTTTTPNVRIRQPTSASWHHRRRPAQRLIGPVDNHGSGLRSICSVWRGGTERTERKGDRTRAAEGDQRRWARALA
jgi:hypothetical protein